MSHADSHNGFKILCRISPSAAVTQILNEQGPIAAGLTSSRARWPHSNQMKKSLPIFNHLIARVGILVVFVMGDLLAQVAMPQHKRNVNKSTLCVTMAVAVWVVALLVVATTVVRADGLRLQGTTGYRFYNSTGERVIFGHKSNFTLDVDRAGTYLLEFHSTVNTNGYFVAGFDGTNHFHIMYSSRLSKSPGSADLTEAKPLEQLNHAAQEWLGPYPIDVMTLERVVWLALASGQYLGDPGSQRMPAPWRKPREEILAYSFTNVVTQDSTWLGAPVKAEFFTCAAPEVANLPNLVVPNSESFQESREKEERKVRALKPGVLAARYSVEAFTNLAGAQVPLTCKLEVFWSGFGRNATNLTPAELYTISVSNLATVDSRVNGEPKIIGTLSVDDYRYKYQDPKRAFNQLRYRVTNQVWRAIQNTELQTASQVMKNIPRYASARSRDVKRAIVVVVASG